MLQVPENCGEAAENGQARSALSPQFIVSFSGAMYFGLTSTNASAYDIFICGFQREPKAPGVRSGSLTPEKMLQDPENCGKAAENERAQKCTFPPVHINLYKSLQCGCRSYISPHSVGAYLM